MKGGALRGILDFGPWPEAPVLLACSGGADSTYLAALWRDAEVLAAHEDFFLPEAHIVVVDHRQRAESALECTQAAARYREMGFAVMMREADCPRGATEAQMREARYEVLLACAASLGAKRILTAHHADDQAETLLLRILRGTGLAGLRGIPARRALTPEVEVLRPMLGCTRKVIETTLQHRGLEWQEDPSNQDLGLAARNRLRAFLPLWREQLGQLGPAEPAQALLRLQQEAEAHEHMIEAFDDPQWKWAELPSHVRQQILRRRLRECGATPSPQRLADLEGALLKRGSAAVDDDYRLSLRKGLLVLRFRRGDRPEGGTRTDGDILEQGS